MKTCRECERGNHRHCTGGMKVNFQLYRCPCTCPGSPFKRNPTNDYHYTAGMRGGDIYPTYVEPAVRVKEPVAVESPVRVKDPLAVELGRRGGLKGGPARAEKLSADERSRIAKKGALARWSRRGEYPCRAVGCGRVYSSYWWRVKHEGAHPGPRKALAILAPYLTSTTSNVTVRPSKEEIYADNRKDPRKD